MSIQFWVVSKVLSCACELKGEIRLVILAWKLLHWFPGCCMNCWILLALIRSKSREPLIYIYIYVHIYIYIYVYTQWVRPKQRWNLGIVWTVNKSLTFGHGRLVGNTTYESEYHLNIFERRYPTGWQHNIHEKYTLPWYRTSLCDQKTYLTSDKPTIMCLFVSHDIPLLQFVVPFGTINWPPCCVGLGSLLGSVGLIRGFWRWLLNIFQSLP